jgi:hypothetical protein
MEPEHGDTNRQSHKKAAPASRLGGFFVRHDLERSGNRLAHQPAQERSGLSKIK